MEKEIIDIMRDGEPKTAIWIGNDEFGIPKHLMQGEKQKGVILDDDGPRPWFWDGLCAIDGERYVYFSPCRIRPIYELATTARQNALKIVRNAAKALVGMNREYLDLTTGILPLSRLWIYGDDGILVLPPDLGDLFQIMRTEDRKDAELNRLIQGTAEKPFLLITEMAELLYYAASGRFPFASDAVRGSGYREVPISLYEKLPEKTEGFLNFIFHAKNREMREIMGNRDGGECLSWFITRSKDLEWPLENISEEEKERRIRTAEEAPEYMDFFTRRERISKRNAFWRVKGTIIIVCTVIALCLGIFLWSYISGLLEPPTTKDLDQIGIIEAFYDAQNDCNPDELSTALKGCDAPQEMEIINLFVSSRTRMAYESYDPLIGADEWVESGKAAVPESSYIYGAIIDSIESTGKDSYIVHGTWYTPFPYDDSEQVVPDEGHLPVYEYSVTQSFTFTWNDRGWWNITDTEITGYSFIGAEMVETYPLLREI